MGFSWTPITQLITEVAADHQNEIKANVDIVYSDLALSQYDWEYLPVSTDEEMFHEHFKEMRDAIDYADDMNYCRSHDTGYNVDDKATHRATVHSGQKTGVDGAYRATVYSDQDSGYDSTYDSGVDGAYDSTVYSGQKSDYQASYNLGVDVGHDTTVYGDYDNGILSWHEATVKGDHKFTVYSSVNETYNSGFG